MKCNKWNSSFHCPLKRAGLDGRTDGWTDGQMDGWTDGWTNG